MIGNYGADITPRRPKEDYTLGLIGENFECDDLLRDAKHQEELSPARIVHLLIFAAMYNRGIHMEDFADADLVSHVIVHTLKLANFHQVPELCIASLEQALHGWGDIC
jgi:hypothetical protein